MGGMVSYLLSWMIPAASYDPTPDPTTGLTERDRQIITNTWALATDKKSLKKNAVEFFLQLFKAYPYLQDKFPLFKGHAASELNTNPKLRAHATSVFYTLTSYVENVDDPETLVGLVQKIAASHVDRGITVKDFDNLRLVFLKFLKFLMGDQCTPEIEAAWNKLLLAQNAVYKAREEEMAKAKGK